MDKTDVFVNEVGTQGQDLAFCPLSNRHVDKKGVIVHGHWPSVKEQRSTARMGQDTRESS